VIQENVELVIESLVFSFENSPTLICVKSFFLFLTLGHMTYKHIDRLLASMEERFQNVEEDSSNQFLLANLNPAQTAMHLLQLLKLIEKRYSVASLRTENLAQTII